MKLKDDEEIRRLLAACYAETKVFCRTIFPDRFTRPFASITDQIFTILDDPNIQKAVIAAPRGWGKTSIVNMGYPAKNILYRDKKFIVPVSCTATQAVIQSENLKNKLKSNRLVRELFGDIESKELQFSRDLWQTSTGTMVLPRGAGQQVRGILSDDFRPDLILVDDLEDSEKVMSPDQRRKLSDWFFSDLVNVVDRSKKDWKIVVIGTILHEDSLLNSLLEDPTWYSVKIELCDDNYNSYWPDFMTTEEISALAETYANNGNLHLFHMEYRNSIIPTNAAFQAQFFNYYSEADANLNRDRNIETVVIYDPAKTTNPSSAYTAIVGVGVDLQSRKIYVRDVINEKLHPDDQYRLAFEMCTRLNARVLGYEITGLNEFISYPIENAMKSSGLALELVPLNARGGSRPNSKERRVAALIPFYRQGLVYHNKNACQALESQLLTFPRSKYWDVMDCLAYVVELLDHGERYMYPPDDLPETYPEDDDDFGYTSTLNWRIA